MERLRRIRHSFFPAQLPEPLEEQDWNRFARFRVGAVSVLIAVNLLLRQRLSSEYAAYIGVFDRFMLVGISPQIVSLIANLWLLRRRRVSDATWRAVMLFSMATEVWWTICAAWVEGLSMRPAPHLVLLILVYRILLDRRLGAYTLGCCVMLHGGLVVVERLGWVASNPLGMAMGLSRAGVAYPAPRLLWIPATYVLGWLLANYAVVRLRRTQVALREANEALQRALDEVSSLARTDALTEVWNRRYFEEQLEREVERAQRLDRVVSLLMIDVDGFKEINDRLGHAAGDAVLVRFAELLQSHVRKIDVVARYGGDEFAVLLPETSDDKALMVAERIREAQEREGLHATVSIGVADSFSHGASARELFLAADRALYDAKRGGRDRVELALAIREQASR